LAQSKKSNRELVKLNIQLIDFCVSRYGAASKLGIPANQRAHSISNLMLGTLLFVERFRSTSQRQEAPKYRLRAGRKDICDPLQFAI